MTGTYEGFRIIQLEEEIKGARLEHARLRQVISCAVCPICGEDIADQDWTIDDDEHLVHTECAVSAQIAAAMEQDTVDG